VKARVAIVAGYDAGAVPVLIALLESADPRVREFAVWGLANRSEHAESATGALTRALDDPDPEVRDWAENSLACIRGDAARRGSLAPVVDPSLLRLTGP
jgi:HEAT repeat protein